MKKNRCQNPIVWLAAIAFRTLKEAIASKGENPMSYPRLLTMEEGLGKERSTRT